MKNLMYCLLALTIILFSSSCTKDDIPDRDKLLGVFSVIETCGFGNDSYDLTIIESGAAEDAVVIINLFDWGESMSATVKGDDLTIPSQLADGLTFSGSGNINENNLTINFSVTDGIESENCNAICTRK